MADETSEPTRFVPSGVDARTWIGFEQRIQDRRFKALLDTVSTAIAARDGVTARLALEEARELRPDASEIGRLSARVTQLPSALPGAPVANPYIGSRAFGAIALFVAGIGLVAGLESIRPSAPAPSVRPPALTMPTVTVDELTSPVPAEELQSVDAATGEEGQDLGGEAVGTAGLRRVVVTDTPAAAVPNRDTFRPSSTAAYEAQSLHELPQDVLAVRAGRESGARAEPAGAAAAEARRSVDVLGAAAAFTANVARQPAPILAASPAGVPAVASADMALANVRIAQVLSQYARSIAGAATEGEFESCRIAVQGTAASADCRGRAGAAAPSIESQQPMASAREWHFDLRAVGDTWSIDRVDSRPAGQ